MFTFYNCIAKVSLGNEESVCYIIKQQTGCSPIISLTVKSKYDSGNVDFAQSLTQCMQCPTTDTIRQTIRKKMKSFLKKFKESIEHPYGWGELIIGYLVL